MLSADTVNVISAAPGAGGVPGRHKLTLKGIHLSLNDLRASLNKQIGHERDSRTELEHRFEDRLLKCATHNDIALIADASGEAKEVHTHA